MTVDFAKDAHILVVHGVQSGDDKDIECDKQIRKLVSKSLDQNHIQREFNVTGCFYENINDKAQSFYKHIANAIFKGNPLAGKALKTVVDLAGDVVTASKNTSTAEKIREKIIKQIMDSYNSGHQLLIVSHSLGTVYALDAICKIMQQDNLFEGDDRSTWPVQGLVTMGSPLGLELDFAGLKIFDKCHIHSIHNPGTATFPWHNYFNKLDPIVSGSVFGKPIEVKGAQGPVEKRYSSDAEVSHWRLQGHSVAAGKQWVSAHCAYWKNQKIGDRIVDMLWG